MSDSIDEFISELEKEEARIVVRKEMRRFNKPVTVIEGLNPKTNDLKKISGTLKSKLATGGTVKENYILLQGDHRERAKEILLQLGFRESTIEVY